MRFSWFRKPSLLPDPADPPYVHAAQEARAAMVQTLEQAVDAVVVIDEHNLVVFFNAAAEQLWGYSRHEVLGQNVKLLVPPAIRDAHDGYVNANRHTRINRVVGTSRDVSIVRKDGTALWGMMSISRVELPTGILYTAFIRDVTRDHAIRERLRLLSMGLDETDNAVIITSGTDHIAHVNNGFVRMLGYSLEEAVGQPVRTVLQAPPGVRDEPAAAVSQLGTGASLHADLLVYGKHGQPLWCSIAVNLIRDDAGNVAHTVIVLADITHTKMHEVLHHKVLEAMVSETPMPEIMALVCREVERIAPGVVAVIQQVRGRRLHLLAAPSLPPPAGDPRQGSPIGPQAGACGTAVYRGEAVLSIDIATDPLWSNSRTHLLAWGLRACWSTPIKTGQGHVVGTFAFYYRERRGPDALHRRLVEASTYLCALAIERDATRSRIHHLAFHDTLTNLPNRNLLRIQSDQAIAHAARTGEHLAVLFIDLDRFKQVNDTLGHPAGDALLREVAQRIQRTVRDCDIVGRLSGDEFLVVLTQCDAVQATHAVERIQASLGVAFPVAGAVLNASASIGISLFPDNGRDMETLLQRADIAMYQAKSGGPSRFGFFSEAMNVALQERMAQESALRDALRNNTLRLHYQPLVYLKTGSLYCVEALARWHHPQWGQIPPSHFIPLAQECGLIGELGLWVIGEACRQLADWRARGVAVPAISVNISPTDFRNRQLPGRIAALLTQHALHPTDLILEVTENVLMDANPGTLKTLDELHHNGIRLAVDDFGTGYSSLSYLRCLPVAVLKLDKSFVNDMANVDTAHALTSAVIRIGESLRLMVVAEGVETCEQRQLLDGQGCEVAQGYFFSPPLPPCQLERWLADEVPLPA